MDGDGEILIQARLKDGELWFTIQDNGLGMPLEQAESLLSHGRQFTAVQEGVLESA